MTSLPDRAVASLLTSILICIQDAAMFICVCKAVSDREIRRAVREDGVTSLRELSQRHGLGTCCGKCVPQARELLGQTLAQCPPSSPMRVLGEPIMAAIAGHV